MRQRLHALQWRHSAIHREAYDLSGWTQQKAAPKSGFFEIERCWYGTLSERPAKAPPLLSYPRVRP
jgi:hypothetical protein